MYIRLRWGLHAITYEETRVWWLVVSSVLPSDSYSILRVMHESVNAMLSESGCAVDSKSVAVGCSPNYLLSPVTKDIA